MTSKKLKRKQGFGMWQYHSPHNLGTSKWSGRKQRWVHLDVSPSGWWHWSPGFKVEKLEKPARILGSLTDTRSPGVFMRGMYMRKTMKIGASISISMVWFMVDETEAKPHSPKNLTSSESTPSDPHRLKLPSPKLTHPTVPWTSSLTQQLCYSLLLVARLLWPHPTTLLEAVAAKP